MVLKWLRFYEQSSLYDPHFFEDKPVDQLLDADLEAEHLRLETKDHK